MTENTESCVFLKFRHLIKFENFYTNHPATYLPFVCYNFLLLSILPTIYGEKSSFVETSRIKLLQELKLTLKIIEIFINTTLDIEIVLSEKVFDECILKLKQAHTESTIVKDLIEPMLFPENYMSEHDVVVYNQKLSSLFQKNIITKSSDLLPSQKFFQLLEEENGIVGTGVWGPPFWTVLHFACYVVDNYKSNNNEIKQYLASLSGIFDLLLPCGFCSAHYRGLENTFVVPDIVGEELGNLQRPFPINLPLLALDYAYKNKLFEFYSSLHYHCKPTPINSREALSVEYFKQVYKNFWSVTTGRNE